MSKRTSCREIESVIGESPFEFKELVVHILCLRCTSQVNGKANAVYVSQLRRVNRTFRDEIDTSLLLWRFMMRFTRRVMMEPPVPIRVNTIDEIKAFILFDNDEFELRDYLHRSGPIYDVGSSVAVEDPYTFDYREEFIRARVFYGVKKAHYKKYKKGIDEHCGMIIRLNRLLGY